jgi:GNAT superfamily N-acetyltransferase
MTTPVLLEEGFRGREYLERITDLLVRARQEDPLGGPWNAADLQWWSRSGAYDDSPFSRFWSEPGAPPSICALFPTVRAAIVCTCLWTKSSRDVALQSVLPDVLSDVQAMARERRLSIELEALDSDIEWRRLLERRGFTQVAGGSVQATLPICDAAPPSAANAGLRIGDDTLRAPHEPHHLTQRCGPDIHRKLRRCSLYRPDLDLSVRTPEGSVIAYCICWPDFRNRFAMLEPMRTERAWQRRGLAAALIAEQARRLAELGIQRLEVNYASGNAAAERLYAKAGFLPRFTRVAYRWTGLDAGAVG